MSIPNKNPKWPNWCKETLFECVCDNYHYLNVAFDYTEKGKKLSDNLIFTFLEQPRSLWSLLKEWWRRRSVWWCECEISFNDAKELRDRLNEYLANNLEEKVIRQVADGMNKALKEYGEVFKKLADE